MNAIPLKQALLSVASPKKAEDLSRFFKTGKGSYGEGDVFIGVPVPVIRTVAMQYNQLEKREILSLLEDPIHECRMAALLVWVHQFSKSKDPLFKKDIYQSYLDHADYINNWDLVDLSCPQIVGGYLFKEFRGDLYPLALSAHLWRQRISIVSTLYFIRHNEFADTLAIAELLLHNKQDLIKKAVGWMLREVGKRDLQTERNFLLKFYREMPRTMLRYAIEKFEESDRQAFLNGLY